MRTPLEWANYRIRRLPRKLRLAKEHALWAWRGAVNGARIGWELRVWRQPITDITRYERRISSEHGEDGVLEALFAAVGTTNRYFVEFGSGNGRRCNTAYLARWKGWRGLWMDSTETDRWGRVQQEWVTAENVETLFEKHRVPEAFDLLSIDIDGNDYWVWKAITRYRPRVVVIEYNAAIPPSESRAISYDPRFRWDAMTNYFGASLLALQRLGAQKGYVLVGCERSGTNAFFIQRSLTQGRVVPRDAACAYRPSTCYDGRGFEPHPEHRLVEVIEEERRPGHGSV